MAVNKARFSINGVASTVGPGYDALTGETLSFVLESPSDVFSVTYQVYDPTNPDSPLASWNAPQQLFSNALPTIIPATPATAVTMSINSSSLLSASYIVRATAYLVNGQTHYFERMVTRRVNRLRPTVPGEVTQYNARGWADAVSEMIASFNPFHAPVGIQTTAAVAGNFADMPRGPRSCGMYVSAMFMATQLNTPNNSIIWFVEAAYAADASNVVTQRIAPSVVKKRDLSAGSLVIPTDPTITIVANQLRGVVTGIAATTINWQTRWDVYLTSAITT